MTASAPALELSRSHPSAAPSVVETSLFLGLLVAVLAFGGTEPASFAIVEILFFAIAALVIATDRDALHSIVPRSWWTPALLTGLILLQLCPLPHSFVAVSHGPEQSGMVRLSSSPYDTRTQLLIFLTCLIGFFTAQILSQDRDRKRRLLLFLVGLGGFEAFYGLVQYLTGWQKIFAYAKQYDLEEATGTYINRNHFAGLLELVLPFAIALLLYEYGKLRGNHSHQFRSKRHLIAHADLQRVIFWLAIAILLFAALIFSRSRMGIIAGTASLLIVFTLSAFSRNGRTTGILLSGVFLMLSIGFAVWIGAGPIAGRFEQLAPEYAASTGNRVSIWRDTALLIRQHPFLGTGFGTFPIAFTPFQTTFLGQFVNHAHNDYLELCSDLGIPAALLLIVSILFVAARAVRASVLTKSNFERCVALGCVGSIAAILLHSLTDFNLHIPANALLFSVILGVAVSLPANPRKPGRQYEK